MTDAPRTLAIKRHFSATRDKIWRCWVEGDLLKQWYCPKPWYVSVAEIDLTPGGVCRIVMNGPNGEEQAIPGQYLEVIDGTRLTFTDAFVGNYMPGDKAPFMVGYVILSDADDGGTHMEWGARHWSDETVKAHKDMGFEGGWNAAADQLDELSKTL
jgi:uncharacterized protein YndB with AHSA1/START domain